MIRYVMSIWAIIVAVFNFGPSLILCAGNDDLNDGPCGIKAKRVGKHGKQIANLGCDYPELLYTLRRFGAIHYDWAVQSSAVSKKLKLSWPVQWGSLKTLLRSGCSIDKYQMNSSDTKSNYNEATTDIKEFTYAGDKHGGDNGKRVAKIKLNKRKKNKECVKCKVRKSEENQLKKCSRCREPLYCSRKCQKIHWKKTYRNHCVEYSED
eukprot:497642_1